MFPSKILLSADRRSLIIVWDNKESQTFPALMLRDNSQSSQSKRNRMTGCHGPFSKDIAIKDINLMGSYAINLVFSDGYNKGIFPWEFLHELGEVIVSQTSQEINLQKQMEI